MRKKLWGKIKDRKYHLINIGFKFLEEIEKEIKGKSVKYRGKG